MSSRATPRETLAARQEGTKDYRRTIAQALRLPPGSEDFFQVFVKKNDSDTTQIALSNIESLMGIQGLSLVHHFEPEDGRPVPDAVVNSARGTVLYNFRGVVVKPIPSPSNLLMSAVRSQGGFVTLNGLLGPVRLVTDTVRYREYHLGTLIRFVKLNGVPTFFTSKNIIPQGAWHGNQRLHKMSKRGHAKPFIESVREIAACCDPSLNDGDADHTWFPARTLFSRWEYRFVLCTRDHSTYQAERTPANGYLLYIGAFANWDRNLPEGLTHKTVGDRHETAYVPEYADTPPTANTDDSYIIRSSYIDLATANAMLAGDTRVDPRLSGGSKLIVTGENAAGIPLAYHIVSPGYAHRESTLGNNPSLYAGFLDCLDKQDYDLSKPADASVFLELFPPLQVPGDYLGDVITLQQCLAMVQTGVPLPANLLTGPDLLAQVQSRDIRTIWYNFLLCSNPSVREVVYWFLTRYTWELQKAAELVLNITDKFVGDLELKDHLWSAKKVIMKHGHGGMSVAGIVEYFQDHRLMARKVVHAVLKYAGLKRQAILITEPNATFHDVEDTSYAGVVCKNTGGR